MPNFVSHIAPGFALRGQLRALELTLALSQRAKVTLRLPRPEAVSALNALLEPDDIARVHALSAQPPAIDAIHLQFQPGDCVPPLPDAGVWLVVTEKARAVQPRDLMHYERCLAFAAPNATDATAVEVLDYAVRPAATPAHGAGPADSVLLIGQGDSAHDQLRVQALRQLGTPRIVLFDPYRRVSPLTWPEGVEWVGACPKTARVMHFVTCGKVGLSETVGCSADDHFYCEARAAGLAPLDPQNDGLNGPIQGFDHAVQAFISASVPPPLPSRTYQLEPHRIVHYADWTQAEPPEGDVAAILCPGADAQLSPALWDLMARYKTLWLDPAERPEFFSQLFAGLPELTVRSPSRTPPKINTFAGFLPLLDNMLAHPTPLHLNVMHIGSARSRIQENRDVLDNLQARRARGGTSTVPTLILNTRKLFSSGGMSKGTMGVSVAHDQLRAGLMAAARGRFKLLWCSRHGLTANRQRIYYYPYPGRVGVDGDEIDPPMLQQLLEQNGVDGMCSMDHFLWFTQSARTLWAKRAVPITGMLHSMHSSTTSTEVMMQLLSGPTFEYDRIISPTHVGAQAFANLQEAVSEHLAPMCKAPPRFAGSIEVIPYGVEPAYYRGHSREGCRQALGLALDKPTILSLARFSQREKVDLLPLLLSVRTLRRNHPDVQLLLAGGSDGERYADHVQEMLGLLELEDCVRLFLDVSPEDKLLLYGAADVFTSISDNVQETYGLTILEAMACGVPVVASAWDGHRETVRDGETGILVPTYWTRVPDHLEAVLRLTEGWSGYGQRDLHESVAVDPVALTRAFDQLLRNADLRHRMGARAQEICTRDYDERTQSRRISELLDQQMEEARTATWNIAGAARPFVDRVSQRFAHFPSVQVYDSIRLRVAAEAKDKQWLKSLLAAAGITGRQEVTAVDAILDAATQPIALKDLIVAVAPKALGPDQARMRILRCLKYGVLEKS